MNPSMALPLGTAAPAPAAIARALPFFRTMIAAELFSRSLPASWAHRCTELAILAARAEANVARVDPAGAAIPPPSLRYRALEMVAPAEVRVVILGQDLYPNTEDACGLSFSVPHGRPVPRSLRNIYKEMCEDLGCPLPRHGDLEPWARQGVLLLNHILTVMPGLRRSHVKLGWQEMTDRIVTLLCEDDRPRVWMLWGDDARDKRGLITGCNQLIIESVPPPSPLSAHKGFFGSRPFSRANAHLVAAGLPPIVWGAAGTSVNPAQGCLPLDL
ncbi:MAG: uracil-DNA glycosylase [Proteobacteria bacterium]|nr:MAG: uracil-DNA glycosylase [Pseudomonadota bacterium]